MLGAEGPELPGSWWGKRRKQDCPSRGLPGSVTGAEETEEQGGGPPPHPLPSPAQGETLTALFIAFLFQDYGMLAGRDVPLGQW